MFDFKQRQFNMRLANYIAYRFAREALYIDTGFFDVPNAVDAFDAASAAGIVFW